MKKMRKQGKIRNSPNRCCNNKGKCLNNWYLLTKLKENNSNSNRLKRFLIKILAAIMIRILIRLQVRLHNSTSLKLIFLQISEKQKKYLLIDSKPCKYKLKLTISLGGIFVIFVMLVMEKSLCFCCGMLWIFAFYQKGWFIWFLI